MKQKIKNKKAFTLIEILIVISIIAILVSVGIVSIINAKTKAKDASLKSTASSIQTALTSCCVSSNINPTITPGGFICSSGTERYPKAESIGGGTVNQGCPGGNPYFNVSIDAGTKNKGTYSSADITSTGITYNP